MAASRITVRVSKDTDLLDTVKRLINMKDNTSAHSIKFDADKVTGFNEIDREKIMDGAETAKLNEALKQRLDGVEECLDELKSDARSEESLFNAVKRLIKALSNKGKVPDGTILDGCGNVQALRDHADELEAALAATDMIGNKEVFVGFGRAKKREDRDDIFDEKNLTDLLYQLPDQRSKVEVWLRKCEKMIAEDLGIPEDWFHLEVKGDLK